MRGGHLSNPAVVKLLQPFVVTSWHGSGLSDMPAEVKQVYTGSDVSKESNVFAFVLNQRGRLVHSFKGLQGRRKTGSSYEQEITKARSKLNLSEKSLTGVGKHPLKLPDLTESDTGRPAGIRLFVQHERDSIRSRVPVIEVVPMTSKLWDALSLPDSDTVKELEAETLRSWLVQMYPAGIRTSDQKQPFRTVTGTLRLKRVASDKQFTYALLFGNVRLSKGKEKSALEGTLEAVFTYHRGTDKVHSVRGVFEGTYIYRVRRTQRLKLTTAIESRPE